MAKRFVIVSLLLMLLYNLFGYIAAFHLIQCEWRSYVREQLYHLTDKEKIVSFTFSKTDFDISQSEFVQNGRFYDVIKYEIVDDFIKVYCFDDSIETQLTTQFQDILLQNSIQKSNFDGKIQGLLSSLVKEFIFESSFSLKSPPSVCEAQNRGFSFQNHLHLHLSPLIEAPPPKFFS